MMPRPLSRAGMATPGASRLSASTAPPRRACPRLALRPHASHGSRSPCTEPTGSGELDPRLQLELLLPLSAAPCTSQQPAEGSSSPAPPHLPRTSYQGAPPRPVPGVAAAEHQQQQVEAVRWQLEQRVGTPAEAAALEPPAAQQQHHHHEKGVLTRLFDQTMERVGIRMSDRAKGLFCLNVLVLLYATNWVVIKDSNSSFDPFAFSFLRFTVAAAAFAPFLKAASGDRRVINAGIELGIWTAAGYLLQSQGLLTTDASRASFLSTFTVIIVPILAGLSGRGVQPLTWFSAVAALCGMSLLEGGGSPPSLGDVWSFLSALAFGVQVFRTEHWARTLGPKRALPLMSVVLAVTMACSLGAAVVAHPGPALELLGHPWLAQQALTSGQFPWQAALYTGLLTTDVCLLMEVIALRNVSSTEAAIVYALEPVLGAFFAYMLLGERWGPLGWAGAALIIASSLVMQLYGQEQGEPVLESGSESEKED